MSTLLQAFDMVKADDKILAFVCSTIIVMTLILVGNDQAANITMNVITGMFGAAVGRATKS